jgi:hypothetical protein
MTRTLLFLIAFCISAGFAQSDSVRVPLEFRVAPSVRTVAIEASTLWFSYEGFGGTVDIDLVQLPLASVQGAGIRLNYEEFRKGTVLSFDSHVTPVTFTRSVYLRGSFKVGNARSDALIGFRRGTPQGTLMNTQLEFGIDIRAIIVRPLGSVFGRILGSQNGISMQFGVAVGYID